MSELLACTNYRKKLIFVQSSLPLGWELLKQTRRAVHFSNVNFSVKLWNHLSSHSSGDVVLACSINITWKHCEFGGFSVKLWCLLKCFNRTALCYRSCVKRVAHTVVNVPAGRKFIYSLTHALQRMQVATYIQHSWSTLLSDWFKLFTRCL